jgi:hypothetical protein
MALTTDARFAGLWSVTRDIEDFAGGPAGRFRGIARLTREEGGLRYAEQGWLRLGAQKMQAHRVYLWRFDGARRVRVLFDDGRPFHVFDWSGVESADEHLCARDLYKVRYSFARESWHAHWRVTGQMKDYAATSRYLRLAPQTLAQGEARAYGPPAAARSAESDQTDDAARGDTQEGEA